MSRGGNVILILAPQEDGHARYVVEKLLAHKADYFFYDASLLPAYSSLSLRITDETEDMLLESEGGTVSTSEITAVWNRRRGQPSAPAGIGNKGIREYVEKETQFFFDNLPHLIPVPWVSHPDAISVASRKAYQLQVAKEIGFSISPTYVGNSPKQAEEFSCEMEKIAVKSLGRPFVEVSVSDKAVAFYTQCVSQEQFASLLPRIKNCPTMVQPYVEKAFELRITVVDTQVFSCAIYSQDTERTKIDWRRYDLENTPHEVFSLPSEIEKMCRDLLRELGLLFGCIDVIVTPDGHYIFLEINPNGQWHWIEQLSGLPIGEAIATLLIEGPTPEHTNSTGRG